MKIEAACPLAPQSEVAASNSKNSAELGEFFQEIGQCSAKLDETIVPPSNAEAEKTRDIQLGFLGLLLGHEMISPSKPGDDSPVERKEEVSADEAEAAAAACSLPVMAFLQPAAIEPVSAPETCVTREQPVAVPDRVSMIRLANPTPSDPVPEPPMLCDAIPVPSSEGEGAPAPAVADQGETRDEVAAEGMRRSEQKEIAGKPSLPISEIVDTQSILHPEGALKTGLHPEVPMEASESASVWKAASESAARGENLKDLPRPSELSKSTEIPLLEKTSAPVKEPANVQPQFQFFAKSETTMGFQQGGTGKENGPPAPKVETVSFVPEMKNAVSLQNELASAQESSSKVTPGGASSFVFEVAERIQVQLRAGGGAMRVQLKPEHLGHLEIRAETTAAGLIARITAESDHVRNYLESNLSLLRQNLDDQGLKIVRIDVVLQDGFDLGPHTGQQGAPSREATSSNAAATAATGKSESEANPESISLDRFNSKGTFHKVA